VSYGFWIIGEILIDVSTSSHIKAIIANPDIFKTTHEIIKSIYAEYREPMGFEGKARLEIVRSAIINTGFTRIRQHIRPSEYWSIDFRSFDESKSDIVNFIATSVKTSIMSKYDQLVLSGLLDDYCESITADDLLSKYEH
jgi:hypothetical protein